jgi:hypothetical protein
MKTSDIVKELLLLAIGACGGFGGAIVLDNASKSMGYELIYVALALLFIYLVIQFYPIISFKIWPDRSNWRAQLPNEGVYKKGHETYGWITNRDQCKHDMFFLSIEKENHRGRVIDKIWFNDKDLSSIKCPKEWVLRIYGEDGNLVFEEQKQESRPYENILHVLKIPVKAKQITVEIIEPENTRWGVSNIEIQEVMLFRKFWRHNI